MSVILYLSQKCKNCQNVLRLLSTYEDLDKKIIKCVYGNTKFPPNIRSVPSLVVPLKNNRQKLLQGNDITNWIMNQTSKMGGFNNVDIYESSYDSIFSEGASYTRPESIGMSSGKEGEIAYKPLFTNDKLRVGLSDNDYFKISKTDQEMKQTNLDSHQYSDGKSMEQRLEEFSRQREQENSLFSKNNKQY